MDGLVKLNGRLSMKNVLICPRHFGCLLTPSMWFHQNSYLWVDAYFHCVHAVKFILPGQRYILYGMLRVFPLDFYLFHCLSFEHLMFPSQLNTFPFVTFWKVCAVTHMWAYLCRDVFIGMYLWIYYNILYYAFLIK